MDSNQGPSAYQPNALSLGHTSLQGGVDIDVFKAIFLHVHLSGENIIPAVNSVSDGLIFQC